MQINPTKTVNELITALSYAVDLEGNKNFYHSWRTAILAAEIAKGLVAARELKDIFYASLLCDIAGVEFNRHILYYLKRSDRKSRDLLLSHPIIGAQLVSNIPNMSEASRLILDHHEWINGTGYPRAKRKENISLGAQIIRLADSIDIALQKEKGLTLENLETNLSLNIDKEYPGALFKKAVTVLERNNFFRQISNPTNLPILLRVTMGFVGYIPIQPKVDAIGKALEAMAQIIDMKHPFTAGHSLRVSRYAMSCALKMKLSHDEVTRIKWAGYIHDIGKLNIPRKILDKTTKLTKKEYNQIKKHPLFTARIMHMVPSLKELIPTVAGHHERFDGKGYPWGLKAKEIPLGAQILALCDAFDAMTSNRPYRRPLTILEACKEIKKEGGEQFDPDLIKKILPLFKTLGL